MGISKDYEPPPQLTLEDKNLTKSNKRQKFSAFNASHDCASLSSSTRDICEMKLLYTEPPNNENNQNNCNIISMSEIPIILAPSTHVSSGIETAATHHEEVASIQKPVTNATLVVYDKIQQRILQEYTKIKQYTQSIDTRLKRLESGKIKEKNNFYEEVQIIQNQLPLKTIDQVSHFDQSMEDENIKKAFIMFIKRIGGNTATDNVKAILKRIFTNELGTQCSWLGQRNNFKICDLSIMAIIKDVILSVHYDFQEIHFRKVVSEWLRLSKLRLSRDQKHRHDIQANADNLLEEN